MKIEMTAGTQYAPLLIGVCHQDGAMLCADSRTTVYNGETFMTDDNCRKVFRVNDRLLFGACGLFREEDRLIEPLAGQDCASLDVDAAAALCEEYLLGELALGRETLPRVFLLGGTDNDGRSCLVYLTYDKEAGQIEIEKRIADEVGSYMLMLPPRCVDQLGAWHEKLEAVLQDDGAPLPERLRGYVAEIAEVSDLVGGKVRCVGVKK